MVGSGSFSSKYLPLPDHDSVLLPLSGYDAANKKIASRTVRLHKKKTSSKTLFSILITLIFANS